MIQRSRRVWMLMGLLGVLALYSIYLAVSRIYQVDEAQNLYMARIIGTHQTASFFTNAGLWLLGPLAWLAGSGAASVDIFFWSRLVFLGVFWGNVTLIALNTGVRLRSLQGLAVLAGAATLAPLWDYGFEIRHDNLLLLGFLLIWYVGRTRPGGTAAYVLIGFLTVVLQFTAFKAFVYVVPLSLAFLVFPPPGHGVSRLRLVLAWGAGALAAFVLCRVAYDVSGLWVAHASGAVGTARGSLDGQRFGPWLALRRTLDQTPLLLAVAVGALVGLAWQAIGKGREAFSWDSPLPEALLWLGSLAALAINPTPFPYNLVNVVPFAYLLAIRFLPQALAGLKDQPLQMALAGGIVVFAHGVPFLTATWRHLDRTNARQETLMGVAESMTDPRQDKVYDGIGMVLTRPSINFRWYLHSLNIQSYRGAGGSRLSAMIAANPPAVVIPSYRMSWLPPEDWDYIRAHYLPLAADFWVLGQVVDEGSASFDVLHGGRYLVFGKGGGIHKPVPGTLLDGHPVTGEAVRLEKGVHRLAGAPAAAMVVIWVGPTSDRLPLLGPGDPGDLFVNWY